MKNLLWAAMGSATSVLLLAAGCSPSDRPELGDVTGTVKLDGKPLAGAVVTFQPEEGRPSQGITDESGVYTAMYAPDTDGAKVGKHSVTIVLGGDGEAPPIQEGRAPPPKQTVPARYNTSTELTAQVQSGENVFDWDLQSK